MKTILNPLISFVAVGVATFMSSASLNQSTNAQCYYDPVTGRKICAQLPQNPTIDSSAHCRITVGDGSVGSGVLVSRDDATGLVLTCSHLFDDATGRIIVAFPSGKRFAALLLDRDQEHDLAALSIRRPNFEPLSVSAAIPAGVLAACGFGANGQFRSIRGSITGQATAVGAQFPSLTIQGAVRPGDSGGGVLNAVGQLVGIVWGQRDGMTYATFGQPVRDFLQRVLHGEPVNKQPPIADGPPSSLQSPASSPQLDWPAWSAEIEARVQSLDDKKQDKGDYLQ